MAFLDVLMGFIRDVLESLFSSSSPEVQKKHQLKQIATTLKESNPPLYRQDGVLLTPFPATLYQMFHYLQPIKETLSSTIASPDKRVSEHSRDFLIELVLTPEQRKVRKSFTFAERSGAILKQKLSPERAIEEQGKQFGVFLKIFDSQLMHQAGNLLEKLDALVDFCEFDFNNLFSYFDPAFKTHAGQDSTVEAPSFHPVEVAEIVPVLLDLYYVLSKLDINTSIVELVEVLEARKSKTDLNDELKHRIGKIFQAIIWLLQNRLGKNTILSIIRLTKEEPDFKPEQPSIQTDYILEYKNRITEFFQSDSQKMLKDLQSNEMQTLINTTFSGRTLEKMEGYTDSTNSLIQEFTPFSLEWIKPLEIIKTFAQWYFDPHFKQILRSLIVEGYFNNRSLQSTLSSPYYYCEAVLSKLKEFETLFEENQPCSIKILTGYLTEMEKGMDFEKPLRKMIENMNGHAKALVQQTVNQYAEVFNFSMIIIEDNKKPMPEYITNIKTLTGSAKNSESYAYLEKEIGVFRNFLEIMKKYAIVSTLSVPASLTEQTES